MPPAETYRDLLMHRGYGYPLWEPNPREALPVELADGTFQGPLLRILLSNTDLHNPQWDT